MNRGHRSPFCKGFILVCAIPIILWSNFATVFVLAGENGGDPNNNPPIEELADDKKIENPEEKPVEKPVEKTGKEEKKVEELEEPEKKPEEEPVVEDKAAPVISDVNFGNASSFTDSQSQTVYYADSKCPLEILAKVEDLEPEDESYDASGVDANQVYVVFADDSVALMEAEENIEDTYSWVPEENAYRNYEIKGIRATDNAGNTSEITVNRRICYYNAEEDAGNITISVTSDGDWYSVSANGGAVPEITVTAQTVRELDSVCISDIDSNAIDIQKSYENGIYKLTAKANVKNIEGKSDYVVAYKFCGDEASQQIGTLSCSIDNTAPTTVVTVEAETVENEKNLLKKLSKKVVSFFNRKVDVLIFVPANCDDKDANGDCATLSGLKSVTYTVNGTEKEKSVSEDDLRTVDNKNAKGTSQYYVITETLDTSAETVYELEVTALTDNAGNVAYSSEGKIEDGKGEFVIDKTGPVIAIDNIKNPDADEDYAFFQDGIQGTVTITDFDIDEDSVSFDKPEGEELLYDAKILVPTMTAESEEYLANLGSMDLVTRLEYSYSTDEDGVYVIYASAKDLMGHGNSCRTKYLVIDRTAPEVNVEYSFGDPAGENETYVNSNATITVNIKDRWLDTESSVVKVKKISIDGSEQTTELKEFEGELGQEDWKLSFVTEGDGIYQVSVEAVDLCGNGPSTVEDPGFTVDTTAPDVEMEIDNNEPMNEKYYNKARTARITVTDLSFDQEASKPKLEQKYGTANESEWAQTGTFTYEKTIEFNKDGVYTFDIGCSDKAGNSSEVLHEDEFVVDTTAPEIKVTYDKEEGHNEKYFKDTRIATVGVKDLSFDGKLVEVGIQPVEDGGTLPKITGFATTEDLSTGYMIFDQDGTYGYTIKCTDLAGNVSETYMSDVFVIDKTAPEVSFEGVANFSANNGTVAPTVSYVDKYMDMEATKVTLTGANNGPVQTGSVVKPTENGFVASFSDFAHEKQMDDLYVLEATVVDMAGNETKEELVFSVNRFGSVFVLGDGTKVLNDQYYINDPKDVTITEINVDTLTYKDVNLTRDGDIIELAKDRDYTVSQQGSDTTWKTYTYTIPKENFEVDGVYSVTVYTEDRATNTQDNKSKDAEITFAVDRTAPSIVTVGLKEDEQYKESAHEFLVDVTDNMGVKSLTVYIDGQIVQNYSGEELAQAGSTVSATINESDETHTVTIISEDMAGNKETLVYNGILVSTKETIGSGDDGNGGLPEVLGVTKGAYVALIIVLSTTGAGLATGAGILMFRKR